MQAPLLSQVHNQMVEKESALSELSLHDFGDVSFA
jgi:hypothetical protein